MENSPPTPEKEATAASSTANPTVPRRKLLMLEDDVELTDLLRSYLEKFHYEVVCVPNGVEGLKRIMESDFDVILCDLVMPHLPGDMFYLAVERTKPRLTKRFIFMTGHRADPKWDAFVRKISGVILWKPFQLFELMERIQMIDAKLQADELASAKRMAESARPL
jgi:DNA-binding response OmpR family regulator